MAVEINSIPAFTLFAHFLSLLCSVVSCIYVPLPNKKSGNLSLILLGAVAVHINVFLRIQYKLQDLYLFSNYYFLFREGFQFNGGLLDILEITDLCKKEHAFSDLSGLFLNLVSVYSHK